MHFFAIVKQNPTTKIRFVPRLSFLWYIGLLTCPDTLLIITFQFFRGFSQPQGSNHNSELLQ